jgi:hypothetical protein
MDRSRLQIALTLLLSLPTGAEDPGYLRLKRAEIIDKHGFEKPMPAMSMLIPTDWTFEGEVRFAQKVGNPEDLARGGFFAVG